MRIPFLELTCRFLWLVISELECGVCQPIRAALCFSARVARSCLVNTILHFRRWQSLACACPLRIGEFLQLLGLRNFAAVVGELIWLHLSELKNFC